MLYNPVDVYISYSMSGCRLIGYLIQYQKHSQIFHKQFCEKSDLIPLNDMGRQQAVIIVILPSPMLWDRS